jgi:signal transduction histidine kinase
VARKKDSPDLGRDASIRKRLTNTALYPSAVLFGIVVCILAGLGAPAVYSKVVATGVKQVSIPAIRALAAAQVERQMSLTTLAHAGSGLSELVQQQQRTDQMLGVMRGAMSSMLGLAPQPVVTGVNRLNGYLDQLPRIRGQVDSGTISPNQVDTFYNGLLGSATDLFETQARIPPDPQIPQRAIMAMELFRASDLMSQESSLVGSGLAGGSLSPAEYAKFTSLAGAYHYLLERAAPYIEPAAQASYQDLLRAPEWQRLSADENAIIQRGPFNGGANLPVQLAEWQSLTTGIAGKLTDLTLLQGTLVADLGVTDANMDLMWAALGTVLALLAALTSVYLARRVSGSLVDRTLLDRLKRLRDDASGTENRIKSITERLRRHEPVDIENEFPQLDQGDDEIGQLARELNKSNQTMVQAVADEATTRTGVTKVLQTISGQSQLLAHNVIDKIVSWRDREEDESRLAKLYEIDALVTQIRRRADGLVAVSGGKPSVRHRSPQPLGDVLLGAAAETDQYRRVVIEDTPAVTLSAAAIEDTTHMLSHLIENALEFSNPNTRVYVNSIVVTNGIAVEIVDQGVGMEPAELERVNAMMATEPQVNVMALQDEPRLGFFVVAQLAARQGIKVTLDTSRYGGVRATALIPRSLIFDGSAADASGRHAVPAAELLPAGAGQGSERAMGAVATGSVAGQLTTSLTGQLHLGSYEEKLDAMSRQADTHTGPQQAENGRPPASRRASTPTGPQQTDDGRPPLPRREPQQNIPAELLNPPQSISVVSEEQAQRRIDSLVDFARGTDEGRVGRDPQ